MNRTALPFQPLRQSLYTSAELSEGFTTDPDSMAGMADFRSFQYFVQKGRAAVADPYAGMMEALHDSSILRSMFAFLEGRQRVAAIMGGHREERGSKTYSDVVTLAKRLSEDGFLMASGGGPGAMEATHLGALLKGQSDAVVHQAIDRLKAQPTLPPDAGQVVSTDGWTIDTRIMHALHAWSAPAHDLMRSIEAPGESLAVPTWQYGHEPVTPLASHAAKYFQNSIREDVLLYLAIQGIIFAPGRAGTLQEVFQDAAQNYYPGDNNLFSPMVFFDAGGFWTKTLPVRPLLEGLFTLGRKEQQFQENVLFSEDVDEIIEFLRRKAPPQAAVALRLQQLGMMPAKAAASAG